MRNRTASTPKQLQRIALGFRKGLLKQKPSTGMCFAVSTALEGYLSMEGIKCRLQKGKILGFEHYWLILPDTGDILDATADQFQKPDGTAMPPVYVGPKPDWYK